MRTPTPRPAPKHSATPDPKDRVYGGYGGMSLHRAWRTGATGSSPKEANRPPWKLAVLVMMMLAVPVVSVVLLSVWNAPEEVVPDPVALALARGADLEVCSASAGRESGEGTLENKRMVDQCMIDRGWSP